MKRVLLSFDKNKCPYNCLYCFNNWNVPNDNYDQIPLIDFKEDIVTYPFCNNDIGAVNNIEFLGNYLENCIISQSKFVIISIATKTNLSDELLNVISLLNQKYSNKAIIVISVSISCKSMIKDIEPNAATYEDRLLLLNKCNSIGIPSSVLIKPILPFINIGEYNQIIDDVAIYVKSVVFGDLYVNSDNNYFYNKYINNIFKIKTRIVSWLKRKPSWPVIESIDTVNQLKEYTRTKNIQCFNNDVDNVIFLRDYFLSTT
jgi:DNA repair photolyase